MRLTLAALALAASSCEAERSIASQTTIFEGRECVVVHRSVVALKGVQSDVADELVADCGDGEETILVRVEEPVRYVIHVEPSAGGPRVAVGFCPGVGAKALDALKARIATLRAEKPRLADVRFAPYVDQAACKRPGGDTRWVPSLEK